MKFNTRWDLIVGSKGQRAQDFNRPWYRYAMQLLGNNVSPKQRVLELCCGAGEFSQLLADRGIQTVSVDGDIRNIEKLKAKGFTAVAADLEESLPLNSADFDVVVILEGIEHIVNCENLIAECYRVLKHGGLLLLSTPNIAWIQDRVRLFFGKNVPNEGVHLRFFTVKSLCTMLKKGGFDVVSTNSFTALIGINRLLRILMNRPPIFVKVTHLQSLLAQDFVWLCKKVKDTE